MLYKNLSTLKKLRQELYSLITECNNLYDELRSEWEGIPSSARPEDSESAYDNMSNMGDIANQLEEAFDAIDDLVQENDDDESDNE